MAQEVNLDEIVFYYTDSFIPAYADLVSLTADKPSQVLIEIENFNSHLVAALRDGPDSEDGKQNLKKAKGHLQRGALDCYKLLFVEINNRIRDYVRGLSTTDVEFAMGDGYKDHLNSWYEFSEMIRESRKLELMSTGSPRIEETITEYRDAVEHGFTLYAVLSNAQPKIEHIRHHLFWHTWKSHWPFHLAEIIFAGFLAYIVHSLVT